MGPGPSAPEEIHLSSPKKLVITLTKTARAPLNPFVSVEKRKQNFLDAFGPGDPEEVCDKLYQVFPHKDGSFFMSVSEAGVATMSAWVRNRDEILRNGKFNQEGHDYMWGYSKPGQLKWLDH